MNRRRISQMLILLLIVVLLGIMVYSGYRLLETTVFSPADTDAKTDSKVLIRAGKKYYPRQDITTVLLMGIDQSGPVRDSGSYNNEGAADMVTLAIFDQADETCTLLSLNRDTMMDIPVLGLGGKEAGTVYGQLALSHTYGSGLRDSCENTCKAVSNFLYGVQIDHFVAMNTDAIALLNDAVGGVKVTVTEDFSAVDPSLAMGDVVLRGKQAISFVQSRSGVGNQLNVSRMERQKQYMNGFIRAMQSKQQTQPGWELEAYDAAEEYLVTDCTIKTMSSLLNRYGHYTLKETVSPRGENRVGEPYMEFYVDEQALDALILRLLYEPIR